jgi:histone demethylase JARID1
MLFQIIRKKTDYISGVSSPWLYMGSLFASFCWHVEDLYMYSLNYMHHGSPKIWYSVPHNEKEKLDKLNFQHLTLFLLP